MEDFAFFRELRRPDQIDAVITILLENEASLYGSDLDLRSRRDKDGKFPADLILELYSQVRVFWAFVLVLCRYLIRGEQFLSVDDARFLGLVDEVIGRDDPEPKRLFRRKQAKLVAAAAADAPSGKTKPA